MSKDVILFTMVGCPFCTDMKNLLDEEGIDYYEMDIHENPQEFDVFTDIVGNDYIPAFMLVEDMDKESPVSKCYAPDRDYNELSEGVDIIKGFLAN
jgi:glutaredoxin